MHHQLKVQYKQIDSVIPYARNARTHSRQQIKQLANSMNSFGFTNPVLVDKDGVIVAGHARVLAARQLGLEVIPTICIDHLSEAEKRAYILADNRLAESAGWDADLLKVELEFLSNVGIDFDATLTGFSTTDIDLILEHDAVPSSDDETPPLPPQEEVVSEIGDLWLLSRHKLTIGDARCTEVVERVMQGERAQMVLSDPPWNVPIDGHVSGLGCIQHREFPMACGELSSAEYTTFLTDVLQQFYRISVDGSLHYTWIDWRHLPELYAASNAVYDSQVNLIVWRKTGAGMGSLYRSQHELALISKKGKSPHINNVQLGQNGRSRSNVWTYAGMNSFGPDREESLHLHPTAKPVQMLADAMLDVTRPGDIVVDFFLGSGSTVLAAERTGRTCYGIELDAGYGDVAIARWEHATGLQATLAGTEKTFDEVAADRGVRREVVS